MAEADITTISTTADGAAAWGPPMRGAFVTLAVIDGGTAVASRRTLGTGAQQSAPGNHTHTSVSITDFATAVRATRPITNLQTGLAYTLVLGDAEQIVERSNAAANTLTIPANATAAFVIGTSLTVVQVGAGQTTIAAAAGVAIRSRGTALKLAGQWAVASLIKRAGDEWVLAGDVTV